MWAPWGPWSDCSATCGIDSVRTRIRPCINGTAGRSHCPNPEERDEINCNLEVIVHLCTFSET